MTHAENAQIAVLQTEMKHLKDQFDEHRAEAKRDADELRKMLQDMKAQMAAWDNQMKGGKTVVGLLMALGTALGSALTWAISNFHYLTGR